MAARAPPLGPGGFVLLWARGASRGTARHPGPSAVSRVRSSTLDTPFLDPRGHQRACTGRDRSPEERRTRHITAAVMRLHSLQVCASSHAARPGCFSAPPLSHTHSRREPGEGRRLRDGEMLIIRGEAADSSQYVNILYCIWYDRYKYILHMSYYIIFNFII